MFRFLAFTNDVVTCHVNYIVCFSKNFIVVFNLCVFIYAVYVKASNLWPHLRCFLVITTYNRIV